ncbi:histidine kinase [Actinosynnema sp. NPDC020468]|uniref:sensor histidine kinase n=1 Tax=Actinosynnema sp. NPDC020468 TaxID=3154488 RepID=UPI0033D1A220
MRDVWIRAPRRDVLVALAFLAFGSLVDLTGLDGALGHDHVGPLWARETLLVLACAGQCFRHRAPLPALAVVVPATLADLASGLSTGVLLVFLDTLFVATLHGPRPLHRSIVAVVGAATVGSTAVAALVGDWRFSIAMGLQAFSLLVVPVWWATNVRTHREGAVQVARIAELDRRAAVDAERTRIARDLHDVVAGHLSAIAIQSEAVLSLRQDDPEAVRAVLRSVRENSLRSLAEMRTMIDVLRADDDVDDPVAVRLADVDRLVSSALAGGLRVRLHGGDVTDLPVAVDVAAYRIVQEALTNVLKHAPGAETSVTLDRQLRRLAVVVRNGVRGHPPRGSGTGLVSMAERAHAVGGEFSAGREGAEWVVRAGLPA